MWFQPFLVIFTAKAIKETSFKKKKEKKRNPSFIFFLSH